MAIAAILSIHPEEFPTSGLTGVIKPGLANESELDIPSE